MLRTLEKAERIETGSFGVFCPYWTLLNGQVIVADTAEEIILALPEERRVVDPAAVMELLQFNHMLGDRTLVQGISRMPWHSVLDGDGTLIRGECLPHGEDSADVADVATEFVRLLSNELLNVTDGHPRVYLLLTGGLDSRVVAGVLKKIERNLQSRITCVTWGREQSRDVVYARQIADWYEWPFVHIPYDADLVWRNILAGATWGGAEVTGIHLHGESWFKDADKNDLVLASSFGDSIGRAEYSYRHLKDLAGIPMANFSNTEELIHPSLVQECFETAEKDRETAWLGEKQLSQTLRWELHLQENYMRRMICHAMDYVRQFCFLHQAFTSDDLVSYMWSLAPECRTDKIYYEVLKDLDAKLLSLPWARNGIAPDGTMETDSSLSASYHRWRKWIHEDLQSRIKENVFSGGLEELGVFFAPAVKRAWNGFLVEPDGCYGATENMVKLCSIELARRHFKLRPCRQPSPQCDRLKDFVEVKSDKIMKAIWSFRASRQRKK